MPSTPAAPPTTPDLSVESSGLRLGAAPPPSPMTAGPAWMLPLILAALATLAPFSIDTYLPSFAAIGESLHASPLQMQQTLSSYLFAFGLMMLFHGALSDSYGRKPVIQVTLVLFALSSLGCALAQDIHTLLVFRILQGLSAGGGMVVGRAIIRDCYAGADAQRLMSQVTMIFGLAPAVAPILGGWLHVMFGWHSIFIFLTALAVALILVARRYLPETLPPPSRQCFRFTPLMHSYREVLGDSRFLLLAFTIGFNFCGFFLYIASAPVFVGQLLHLSETQYAWLFVPGISGVMLGAWLSGRAAGRFSPMRTALAGYVLMGTAATLNLLYNAWFPPALPWSVAPIGLYTVGMSLVMPSLSLIILDLFPHHRGMAASLQNFIGTTMNALVSGVVVPLVSHSGMSLASAMAVQLLAGFACWNVYRLRMRPGRLAPALP